MNNKDLNIHIYFSILLLIALPLTIIMSYISFEIFCSSKIINNNNVIINTQKKDISNIVKLDYQLPEIVYDTDLAKFPSDYDQIIDKLDIDLTQHQKTALLLYGQTLTKSNHTNITDAFGDLIEQNLPILIPQEYINLYLNSELNKYSTESVEANTVINNDLECLKTEFNNIYDQYIYNQLQITLPLSNSIEIPKSISDYEINNALFITNNENINDAYYKAEIIKYMLEDDSMDNIIAFLEYVIDKSTSTDALSFDTQANQIIKEILFYNNLNREGEVYWNISVIEGTSYVYPLYITEEFVIDDNNFNSEYDIKPIAQSSNSVRVPILMYHHIDSLPDSNSSFVQGLYVTPEVFEEQLAYLVKKNYKSLTSQEFYNLLQSSSNPNQKSILITFDDSTLGHYNTAYPLLKKYGLIGVFYIPSNRSILNHNQLREMAENGMIVESHSATHIDLTKETNPDKLYSEIVGSRYKLMDITNQDVISISYPGCVANSTVYSYVSQAGYLLGLSCGKGIDHYFSRRLSLSRVHVFNNMDSFINLLSGIN